VKEFLVPRIILKIINWLKIDNFKSIEFIFIVSLTFASFVCFYALSSSLILSTILLLTLILFINVIIKFKYSRLLNNVKRNFNEFNIGHYSNGFTRLKDVVPDQEKRKILLDQVKSSGSELIIGKYDELNRFYSNYEFLSYLNLRLSSNTSNKRNCKKELVLFNDQLLIKKLYLKNKIGFIRNLKALMILGNSANVPELFSVDFDNYIIYENFIWGFSINNFIINNGTKVVLKQNFRGKINVEGEHELDHTLKLTNNDLIENIQSGLNNIHSYKIANCINGLNNLIYDPVSLSIWFVDFDEAREFKSKNYNIFMVLRDFDRKNINNFFGSSITTEISAKNKLNEKVNNSNDWYAPIDFGKGLTVGNFWSVDTGSGKWDYLNGEILGPLVRNKRVLDLGSDNGIMDLLMLRAGAKEVVALEISPDDVETAKLMKELFEWRDIKTYNLKLYNNNMTEFVNLGLGGFDVVTSFCSLYYLDHEQMKYVVVESAKIAKTMCLQANTTVNLPNRPFISEKASVKFLTQLLTENGYPKVEIYSPSGYSRPLIVATK
tara:strand:- start:3 stop:1649 length:1647 start_codon:yes stop_codon:yes gene_type:complete